MCLIAWSWQPAAQCPLLLAANRDEWLRRPSQPMHWWPGDDPAEPLLAGRDLEGGGTWLGLSRDGRLAALTNVREPSDAQPARPSRGQLVARFLQRRHPLHEGQRWRYDGVALWAAELQRGMQRYAGFNLLLADLRRREMLWVSNRAGATAVAAGVHGLSNAALDTPWPKVLKLQRGLAGCVEGAGDSPARGDFAALLDHLGDPTPASDAEIAAQAESLPLSQSWRRGLSAAFIRLPDYGTRCSTLVRASADGRMQVLEVQHQPAAGRRQFHWNWRE